MEIPVITSRICGIEELVDDGISGVLVPPGDPQAIADAVEKIFSQPDLARKMGEEGRKKIEKDFNVKIEARKLDEIFRDSVEHQNCDKAIKVVLENESNIISNSAVHGRDDRPL